MRTRIKICGITLPDDARKAAALGVDAIGLVFYEPSPRYVSIERARDIIDCLPPFVTKVGLFVNSAPEIVHKTLEKLPIDLLQFHGTEPPNACSMYGWPYIKAIKMSSATKLDEMAEKYYDAQGLLLDTDDSKQHGGTGKPFDWSLVPAEPKKPIIVAGGLNPNNVAKAIARTRPYAVDVSTGVESTTGIKDAELMTEFVNAVATANS